MKNEAVRNSILGMVLAVFLGAAQMAQATPLEKPIVEKQSTTKAQSIGIPDRITITPEIGTNLFKVTGTSATTDTGESLDISTKSGNSVGVIASMPSGVERLTLGGGLEYFQAGMKQEVNLSILSIPLAEVEVSYLSIPLRATYQLNEATADEIRWNIMGSVKPAFLTGAVLKRSAWIDGPAESDIKDSINSFDMFLGVGFGAEYNLSGHTVTIGLNYQKGTQKVLKEDGNSRSEGFAAHLGYVFTL